MTYLTAKDERTAHLADELDTSKAICGGTALPLPGARPLLLARDPLYVTCTDCMSIAHAYVDRSGTNHTDGSGA